MNPLVSLLVPVHNRAELLVPCLESALAQTMPDLEVVVVDGASTDGTWEVCKRYAAADRRIRTYRDEVNAGPVPGWWRCVEEARGRYATFLWSDDMLMPTFLEATLPLLADDQIGFVFTAAEIGAEPGSGRVHYAHPARLVPSRQFIEGSLSRTVDYPVSPACALFRLADLRQSFTPVLPTEPTTDLRATGAGVDLLLFLLTALRYPRVACLPAPLAFFRAHPGSISIDGRAGQVALDYALTRSWFAQTLGEPGLVRAILARHWLHEMIVSRRFVSPRAAAKRYRYVAHAPGLVAAAPAVLARESTRAVSASARRFRSWISPLLPHAR